MPWTQKTGGREPLARIGTSGEDGVEADSPRRTAASPWIVPVSSSPASGSWQPNSRSTAAIIRTAASEWPPRSKKFSITPMGLIPNSSSQILLSRSSHPSLGASYGVSRISPASPGGGRAGPPGPSGIVAMRPKYCGDRCRGSSALR